MTDHPAVAKAPLLAAAFALDAAALALDQLGGWRAAAAARDASFRACRASQASAPSDAALERAARSAFETFEFRYSSGDPTPFDAMTDYQQQCWRDAVRVAFAEAEEQA